MRTKEANKTVLEGRGLNPAIIGQRAIAHDGRWHSRELYSHYGVYSSYYAFVGPIERAKVKCPDRKHHFQWVRETGFLNKVRQSYLLTGYACYLVFKEVKQCQKQQVALEFFSQYQEEAAALVPLEREEEYQQEQFDYKALVDHWLEQEQRGVQFPVDFAIAWRIAGYSTKGKAKDKLMSEKSGLLEGRDYVINPEVFHQSVKWTSSGRSSDIIYLTTDAFKHFCQQAQTAQGEAIRQYFIEVEKDWRKIKTLESSKDDPQLRLAELEHQRAIAQIEKEKEVEKAQLELQKVQTELELQKVMLEAAKEQSSYESALTICKRVGFLCHNGKPDWAKYKLLKDRFANEALPSLARQINKEFPPR